MDLDAYTLRKIAPRILVGVIAINLSIYLCLAAADVVTVIGRGLGQLLTAPFVTADYYNFGVEGNVANTGAAAGIGGIFVASGAFGAAVGAIAFSATNILGILGMLLILVIPIALLALAVMATIVIRQALLVFLIIISPVAFALYIFPGTEKYFRQWWNLYLRTLLVYPIIAAIFALSDVFGAITLNSAATAGGNAADPVKLITGVLVVYAPLFLIPFAFRFAGGVMGQVANIATTGARRVSELGPIKGRREIARQQLSHGTIQQRSDIAGRFQERASRDRGFIGRHVGNRLFRGTSKAVGGYNIEQVASAARSEKMKQLYAQIETGRDEEIRGLTVNKKWADEQGKEDEDWRIQDGKRQYRTLGGAWVDEAHVLGGYSRWGKDSFAQQAALSYEMRKANSSEEVERISQNYAKVATGEGGWGASDSLARGTFIGAGFENQNRHLEFKHTDALTGKLNYERFVNEAYNNRASYPLAQMSPHTIEQLMGSYKDFKAKGDTQGMDKVKSISEMFVQRGLTGGAVTGMAGEEGQEIPQVAPPSAGAAPTGERAARVYASGAGRTNEAIRELAKLTGALEESPSNEYPKYNAPQE